MWGGGLFTKSNEPAERLQSHHNTSSTNIVAWVHVYITTIDRTRWGPTTFENYSVIL